MAKRPAPIDIWAPIEIEELGDFLGRMVGRAAVEHRGQQEVAAARRLRLVGQRAAQDEHLQIDQRQVGIALHQHAQTVGQHFLVDFALGRAAPAVTRLRCPVRRGDNNPIEPLGARNSAGPRRGPAGR